MTAKNIRNRKLCKTLAVGCLGLTVLLGVSMPLHGGAMASGEKDMLMADAKADRETTGDKPALSAPGLAGIQLSFKLDQRLTRSMYMGDRWVSTPTYTKVQDGEKLIVEARAQGLDIHGRQIEIVPEWKAGNTAMVTITPEQGKQVLLTILKEGQSEVTVAFKGVSRKLSVKARRQKEVLVVEITGQVE
jgi:hypothetical protein